MNYFEAATGGVSQAEYCKIFKNTHFEEHLLITACDFLKQLQNNLCFISKRLIRLT